MDTKPDLIGLGRVGKVIRYGDVAIKTANKWTMPDNASDYTIIVHQQMNRTNEECLKHEGDIYRLLGGVDGVLKPPHISDTEIRMSYISHRSLDRYLSGNKDSVSDAQFLRWFQKAAKIIDGVHSQRVIIVDIAARNFLVNEDLSLQLCDFSESVPIPEEAAPEDFLSEDFWPIKFDVARFGSMVYEIVTGRRYEFYVNPEIEDDSDDGASFTYKTWPTTERFPDMSGIFLGDFMRMCWLKDGFSTMKEVQNALQAITTPPEGVSTTPDWCSLLRTTTPAIAAILFAIVVARHLPWHKALNSLPFRR